MKILKENGFLFVALSIIFVVSVVLFNFFVNPYCIFQINRDKKNEIVIDIDRDFIYPYMKLHKKDNYDYALIGDSNSNIIFDEDTFYEITNKTLIKYTLNGISLEEQYDILKAYLALNPDAKNIIIALNFISFVDNRYNWLPNFTFPEKLTFNEISKLLFTKKVTKASYDKLYNAYLINFYENLIIKIRENKFLQKIPFVKNLKVKYVKKTIFPKLKISTVKRKNIYEKSFFYFEEIMNLLNENNVEAIFVINVVHSYTLCNFYEEGMWDTYIEVKRRLAELMLDGGSIYDFSYVNQYNQNPITFESEYTDVMHPDTEFGKKILYEILHDCPNFGMKITKDNVDELLQEQTVLVEQFIKNNSKIVKKYMENRVDNFEKEEEYGYL